MNQPFRFGGLSTQLPIIDTYGLGDLVTGLTVTPEPTSQYTQGGYLTWASSTNNQFVFLLPGHFDPSILKFGESNKQPYTYGELLSMLGLPPMGAPAFKGPVLVLTGEQDLIFCAGNCTATGTSGLPNLPAGLAGAFPNASNFEAYIQKNTGHGFNLHYVSLIYVDENPVTDHFQPERYSWICCGPELFQEPWNKSLIRRPTWARTVHTQFAKSCLVCF